MLLMAFQTSEGPETHIITKLESNPNLREGGGLLATSTKSRGGLLGRGGLLSVYLLILYNQCSSGKVPEEGCSE